MPGLLKEVWAWLTAPVSRGERALRIAEAVFITLYVLFVAYNAIGDLFLQSDQYDCSPAPRAAYMDYDCEPVDDYYP